MSNMQPEIQNESIREEQCMNCKGVGTSFGIRMKARFKSIGTFFVGIIFVNLANSAFIENIGYIILLTGVVQFGLAYRANCPVCKGTGKVQLAVK